MAWRDSVTETDFVLQRRISIYLCFCSCSVTETDAAAMLFSTPSDTMASHLTIHGHRFWVDLQNRSFEMSLFCSHFPRSYLVLMFLSGTTSESWMKTNWVIIRGWMGLKSCLFSSNLSPSVDCLVSNFLQGGYICTTPTVSTFGLAYTTMLSSSTQAHFSVILELNWTEAWQAPRDRNFRLWYPPWPSDHALQLSNSVRTGHQWHEQRTV